MLSLPRSAPSPPPLPPRARAPQDTTTIWLLELLEIYQHTGELTLIESLWPQVQRAAAWQIASTAEIGLPFKLVW